MRVAVVANDVEKTVRTKKKLIKRLVDNKIPIDQENPEIVISIGGDGTLLSAFHKYSDQIDKVRLRFLY